MFSVISSYCFTIIHRWGKALLESVTFGLFKYGRKYLEGIALRAAHTSRLLVRKQTELMNTVRMWLVPVRYYSRPLFM